MRYIENWTEAIATGVTLVIFCVPLALATNLLGGHWLLGVAVGLLWCAWSFYPEDTQR